MPSDAGHRCEYLTFQACPLADLSSAKLELSPRLSSTSSTSFPFLRSNSLTNLSSICQVSLGITTPLHRAHNCQLKLRWDTGDHSKFWNAVLTECLGQGAGISVTNEENATRIQALGALAQEPAIDGEVD